MNQKSSPVQMKWLVPAAIVIALVSVFLAPIAFAKIVNNTIDPLGNVTGNGRQIAVTGPIGCTPLETAYLRVTVTQRSTGAVAEGVHPRQLHRRLSTLGSAGINPGQRVL